MKYFFLIQILFFLNIYSYSQSFMGITIDGTQASVKPKLLQKGFKLLLDKGDTFVYIGKIEQETVYIAVGNTPISKKIYGFYITFEEINNWYDLKSKYENKKQILTEKYGEPRLEEREYEYPFKEEDEKQLLALESEKLTYTNTWFQVGSNNLLDIMLSLDHTKKVTMAYSNRKYNLIRVEEAKKKQKYIY